MAAQKADGRTSAEHDPSVPQTKAVEDDAIQQQRRLSGRLIPLCGRPLVTRLGGEIQSQALGSSPR